jgi:adenylate cyclase
MPVKLLGTHGGQSFELREGEPLTVGRALGSDLPIVDPTVSRRHAELRCDAAGLHVRDLDSVNGTYRNGERITEAVFEVGDVITFGRLSFRVTDVPPTPAATSEERTSTNGPTIVRQRRVAERRSRPADATANGGATTGERDAAHDLNARKLALLLDVSRDLGRLTDTGALLEQVADTVFQIMDVDRTAIMLVAEDGELIPRVARDRWGLGTARSVPRSIARTVVDERVAVLSDNAHEDTRFTGQSIIAQRVRSAMCAPLVGSEDRIIGVLYVDSSTATHRFGDEDLDFLIAFSGIAAVAIENGAFAERIRHEALVRSNFERYFAPTLAARIAQTPGAVQLGGDRRAVTVLFSDLRGFTALSATMRPDETASLLNEYLGAMTECVFRHDGVLDKFLGDGVMAQWGAPIAVDDDTDRAVRAALDMQAALGSLNARWRRTDRPELQIGIGIDRGEVFAGNIGSEHRLEFTVIGDAVNVAARLCDSAAGGEILVTTSVVRALRRPPPLEECPPRTLKGAAAPLTVYRIGR